MARSLSRAETLIALLIALVALISVTNVAVWLIWREPAPYADMVDVSWFLSRWSLAEDGLGPLLTYTDNEHRVLAPLLLQALDVRLFAASGLFLTLVHIVCFAAAAAVFARQAFLGFGPARRAGAAAAAGAMAIFLWSAHWLNIVWTKQTTVALMLVSTAAGFWLIARFDRATAAGGRLPWVALLGGVALLFNAAWSYASGLAALPVAAAFALARPWPWPARAALLLAAAGAVGARILAAPTVGSAPIENPATGLLLIPRYVLNFLGGLSRPALGGDEVLAPILAIAALALAAPLVVMSLRERTRQSAALGPDAAQAASFFTLALVWALAVAVGSAPIRAVYGAEQGFSTRYLPFSVVFVFSTAILAATFRAALPRWTRRASLYVGVFYLAAIVLTTPRGWLLTVEHHRRVALGAVAAELRIDDPQYTLYPFSPFADGRLLELLEDYRSRGASFYRWPPGRWLGAPADFAQLPVERCAPVVGTFAFAPAGENAYRVAAQVDLHAPAWLAVLDAEGRIAGLARRGERFAGPPPSPIAEPNYAGFARLDDPGEARLLAVYRDGVCELAAPSL